MVDKYQNATFIVIITIRLYYSMYPYKWRKTKSKITIKKITCSVIKLAKKRARQRERDNSIYACSLYVYVYMACPIYAKDKKRFDFKPKF